MNLTEFLQACKDRGLSATYQRIAIYKSLQRLNGHPSVEDIYKDVQKEYPSISLATVYTNLETLTTHRLVSKVTSLHDLARYDKDIMSHHHLVCKRCKKIIDIKSDKLEGLKIPRLCEKEFQVEDYKVQFNGICCDCLQA